MSWAPLATEQPIDGDPAQVRSFGQDLERTARLIAEQAEALRALADPTAWVADTADAFRDQASDLEREISKAEGRYSAVGGHVVAWADMIEDARRQAELLRVAAQEQQLILDTSAEAEPQPDPLNPTLPPQLSEVGRQVNDRRGRAQEEIERLRGDLERLVDEHNSNGREFGRLIRAAQDDDLNDGFWDRVRAWIANHAPLLREIATWAGRIAAVVGLIALFITPLGWVAAAAAAIAVLASGVLLISGDGSWGSFLLNVVGLASFGIGAIATRGVVTAFRAGRAARAAPAVAAARSAVLNAADSAVVAGLSRLPLVGNALGAVGRSVQAIVRTPAAVRAGLAVERAAVNAPLAATTFAQRVLYGGRLPAAARSEALAWVDDAALGLDEGLRVLDGTRRIAQTVATSVGATSVVIAEEFFPVLPPNDEFADVGR